jgi:hypothetical protein
MSLNRSKAGNVFVILGMGAFVAATPACSATSSDESSADQSPIGSPTSVSFQDGVSPSTLYAGQTDTNIEQATPTTTDGSDESVHADFDYPDGSGKSIEGLLRFDLSSIPAGSTVTSASLSINVTNRTSGAGYDLYALSRAWTPSQATWNSATTGTAWGAGGARSTSDRSATSIGTLTPTTTGTTTVTLNAAGLAQLNAWIADPSKNYGFIVDTPSDPDGLIFDSSKAPTASSRPKLSVNYAPPVASASNGTGLEGAYYSGTNFQTLVTSRVDPTVDFTWAGSPATGVPADGFSVRWSGQILPQYSQTYTFTTNSDDGIRVWVNDVEIIDNWTDHAATTNRGSIALTAGTKVDIKVEYYQNTGAAVADLSWSSTSQPEQIIPKTQLFPAATTTPPTPTPPATTGFVHPGILNSKAQLDLVKAKIAAGAEPWTSALAKAKSSSAGQLTYKASPVVNMQCGNSGSTLDIGCTPASNDAVAAYTQSLIWYYTGDQRYADNAIAILNAWSELKTIAYNPSDNSTFQGPLEAAWLAESFPRSAEILRYSGAGWSAAEATAFGDMLNNAVLPRIIDGWNGNANWNLSMADGTINIGIYNNDKTTYQNGIAQWRSHVKQDLYNLSDGALPIPLSNEANSSGGWKSTSELTTQWYGQTEFNTARTNGITQETCRDLTHTQFSLASTVYAAETVGIQGTDDLYTEEQNRIITSYEFVANLENLYPRTDKTAVSVASWLCGGTITAQMMPTWEVAYSHYYGDLKVAMPQTERTITYARANVGSYTNLMIAWETLTHAYQ